MSTQKIKFYKFSNSTSSADKIATAKATEGAVIYLVDARELWIGGATAAQAQLVIKGANDVTFSNNVLTINHYDNAGTATTQTLDFSDVASASSTMAVFTALYEKMGLTGQDHDTIDYTGTNYLSTLGGQDQPAKNLVNADKALDTAIYDNTHKGAATGATYDTQHLSQTWTTVVTNNTIAANDTLDADIDKLDKKIAGLADEVIANEQVTQEAFSAVANSVGLESDMSLDLSDANLTVIKDDTSVKEALEDLDAAFATAGKVDDVKINDTTIVSNKIADIAVDGTYNSSSNKIATQSTVTNAINDLDVTGYAQATIDTATTAGQTTLTIKGIKEEDGEIANDTTNDQSVVIDGTYNSSTNKIATQSTITNVIEGLDSVADADDTSAQTGHATVTTTTPSADFKVLNSITEVDGKLTAADAYQLKKLAATGAAADVSVADAQGKITATNVEDALTELATSIAGLVGGMRYNGDINSTTAPVNGSTGDVRSGDIYLASGAFTIGTTSVEAGDMIVYKGSTSSSAVTLTDSNCTIIERETDTMVTAGDTLTDDYIVFGNGGKEVTTTSNDSYTISASDLNTAITKANSALQSISKGTDGTYVTTTVGSKDSNNNQSVGVVVTQSTVTYTAASGQTAATLTATNGLLDESAITPIKNYVDAKVGTAVQSVDGSATEKAKRVTQSDYATVKVTADTDANNNVTLDSAVGLKVQAVSTADSSSTSTMGLAEASDVKNYVDGKIADLDGSATIASKSGNVVTIKTGVTETDGVIDNDSGTDIVLEEVAVTGAAADVSYDNTASGMTATTVQAAIDELKSGLCWEEYE